MIFTFDLHRVISSPYILSLSLYHLSSKEQVTDRDKFMSPEEAKKFGIIDHVLSHRPKQSDSESTSTKWL